MKNRAPANDEKDKEYSEERRALTENYVPSTGSEISKSTCANFIVHYIPCAGVRNKLPLLGHIPFMWRVSRAQDTVESTVLDAGVV